MNYKNGKIYAIRSYQTDMIYIGSTCSPLKKRIWDHKNKYKQYLNGKNIYLTSFEIIKYGDAYIELIQETPCENLLQLRKWEGNYIRNMNCVNKRRPFITREEMLINKKKYYKNNKNHMIQYQKEYRKNNKDKIKKRESRISNCMCGSTFIIANRARHNKSVKHRTYIFNLHNELNHL